MKTQFLHYMRGGPARPFARIESVADAATGPLSYRMRVWLFTAICFVLPMRVSYVYVLSALLLVAWLAEGRLAEKIRAIAGSRLCQAFIAYYAVYVVGMLWTEDMPAGWQMVDRNTPFLLFLLYWSCAEPAYRERNIRAFIGGVAVCAVLAHYNWLQLHWLPEWPRGVRVYKDPADTAPFVDWIMYTPMLALGTYFSMRRMWLATGAGARLAAIAVTCLLVSNLAFAGGRAGMVMFVVMFIALVFERIKAPLKALLLCATVLPLAFFAAYNTLDLFAQRVDKGISDIRNFEDDPGTSVGQRLVYWTTSFQLVRDNPVLGVGTGDFTQEYARIKPQRWAETPDAFNPHNQYLMTAARTGLLGLAALLFIFWQAARSGADRRTHAMVLGFAVVCIFESYFWRSNTALTFAVMLATLAERNKRAMLP
jgi:O-antigen ligase